jgi:hypothetical protein
MILNSSTRKNTFHDLPLSKMIVARFVGTGGFLIIYYKRMYKINVWTVKEVSRIFAKT